MIGCLATYEDCEIGFCREDWRIDAREVGDNFGAGINVFIAWNSSVSGNPDKLYAKGGGWESGKYSVNSCYEGMNGVDIGYGCQGG